MFFGRGRRLRPMQNELSEVKVLFKTLVIRGDTRAISALLKSTDGRDTTCQLTHALLTTEKAMKNQVAASNTLLEIGDIPRESRASATVLIDSEDSDTASRNLDFDTVLQRSAASLDERRTEIARLFHNFSSTLLATQFSSCLGTGCLGGLSRGKSRTHSTRSNCRSSFTHSTSSLAQPKNRRLWNVCMH